MNQNKAEKILSGLYALVVVCGFIGSISMGVTWGHWKLTLNQYCRTEDDRTKNCSCILYGQSYPTNFIGGGLSTCAWIAFGPIPVILIFIGLSAYHGIRACFGSTTEAARSVMTNNEAGEIIHMQIRAAETKPISRTYWIIASTLTTIFTLYMFVYISIYVDGYLHTCKQYRRELIKLLNLTGTAVAVVHSRLSCNAVYDFMDYLQPVSGDIIRDSFINTAAALLSGIVCSSFAVAALCYASVINIKFSRIK